MKQTAVEWLISQILAASINKETEEMHITLPKGVFEQAKAMEKEQIIYAYLKDRRGEFDVVLKLIDDAEQYYNETYEQDKQG